MAIYVIPKPSDMTGRCPTCLADVRKLAEAVQMGAHNLCRDPAHDEPAEPTESPLAREYSPTEG